MNAATNKEEQPEQDCTQSRAVAVVVVISALPQRESIGKEMVVAVASRASENVGDQRQTSLALRCKLDGGLDFRRRGCLESLALLLRLLLSCSLFGSQRLLDLVRVKSS